MTTEKAQRNIAGDVSSLLEREVGFMGPLVFKKQVKELKLVEGSLTPSDLKAISPRIVKAIMPIVGDARAEQIRRSIVDYTRALETLAPGGSDSSGLGTIEAELMLSESKLSMGSRAEAESAARRALALLEKAEAGVKTIMASKVLRNLAKVLSSKKESREEAVQRYNEALAHAKKARDRYEEALSQNGLGLMAWKVADHPEALKHHSAALAAVESMKAVSKADRNRQNGARMRIHMGLGNVYLDLIDMQRAIDHDLKAAEIATHMESWNDVGLIYNNLARVYEEMRDYRNAIDYYERGIQYLHRGKGARMEGWTMTNLASALVETGRANEARPHLEKAERLLADFSDPIAHSKLNCMWGKYHRARREWTLGIERFERSLAVIKDENSPDYLATAQEEFGALYLEKGDAEKARELLGAALEWQRKKGDDYRVKKMEGQLKTLDEGK